MKRAKKILILFEHHHHQLKTAKTDPSCDMALRAPLIDNERHRFPADVSYVPFVQHSETTVSSRGTHNNRLVICGGSYEHQCQFYEIQTDHLESNYQEKRNTDIKFESFSNYYNCKNANLRAIGIKNGEHTYSFMTKDGKLIIVLCEYDGYNIYSIEDDSWLLERNFLKIRINTEARTLFIHDKLLIISQSNHITFHSLTKNIEEPIQIYGHSILHNNARHYSNHGLCVLSIRPTKTLMAQEENGDMRKKFKNKNKNKNKKSPYYLISILLFGGKEVINFRQSFINLLITVSKDFTKVWEIAENIIDSKSIQYVRNNDEYKDEYFNQFKKNNSNNNRGININSKPVRINGNLRFFGYQSLRNNLNETIIVIIGGMCYNKKKTNNEFEFEKSIILYNFDRQQIYIQYNVLPIGCRCDPATMLGIGNGDTDQNLFIYYQSLTKLPIIIELEIPKTVLHTIVSFLDGKM